MPRAKDLTTARRTFLAAALIQGIAGAALASEADEHHGELHHRHHLAVFLGGAVRDEGGTESGFAAGLEYEYRFTRLVGAGILAEVATGGLRDVIVAVPIVLHPWRGLRFLVAPGAEFSSGPTEFALRLGLGYQLPVGRFTIAPEFNVDLIESHPTYVFGVTFGVGF